MFGMLFFILPYFISIDPTHTEGYISFTEHLFMILTSIVAGYAFISIIIIYDHKNKEIKCEE